MLHATELCIQLLSRCGDHQKYKSYLECKVPFAFQQFLNIKHILIFLLVLKILIKYCLHVLSASCLLKLTLSFTTAVWLPTFHSCSSPRQSKKCEHAQQQAILHFKVTRHFIQKEWQVKQKSFVKRHFFQSIWVKTKTTMLFLWRPDCNVICMCNCWITIQIWGSWLKHLNSFSWSVFVLASCKVHDFQIVLLVNYCCWIFQCKLQHPILMHAFLLWHLFCNFITEKAKGSNRV